MNSLNFLFIISNPSGFAQISEGLLRKPLTEISHGIHVGTAHIINLKLVVISSKEVVTRLLFSVAL